MDRRATPASLSSSSELKLLKPAARGWHQHSSGHDVARTPQQPRRLRSVAGVASESSSARPHNTAIPLLDAYEIEWITREMNRLLSAGSRTTRTAEAGDERRPAAVAKTKVAGAGFWVRQAVGVCSSKGAVVDPVAARRCRRPPTAIV